MSDPQLDFVADDEHKFLAYIGGIGAGKTFAGTLKGYRYANDHKGSLGCIGAPNYPQLRDSTMRTVFEIFPSNAIRRYSKTDNILRLKNGSEILFRSMDDPDNRRGPNLAWCWLDEGPLCGYYAWQVMKGRLRQDGFPPRAWITGSPHGQDEFYEDFELEPKPGHKLYRASTRDNEDNLPESFIDDLGYAGQFALQEIEGLFVNFEGLVYDFQRELHTGTWPAKRADGNTIRPALKIGGIDWGFTNPAVALPLWVDGDQHAYLLAEYYERKVGLAGVKQAALDFSREYGIEVWYCGPDEPEHILELNKAFAANGLNAKAVAADDDISTGLETVRQLMKLRSDGTVGLHIAPGCAQTKAEFLKYCYPGGKGNAKRDPNDKPLKFFDHAMDALRYALHSSMPHGLSAPITSMTMESISGKLAALTDLGGVTLLRRML